MDPNNAYILIGLLQLDKFNHYKQYIPFILLLIPIINNILPYFNKVPSFFKINFDNVVSTELVGHLHKLKGFGSTQIDKIIYSKQYEAVLHYIQKYIKNINYRIEILNQKSEYVSDDIDNNYRFIPKECFKTLICKDNDIYCDIKSVNINFDDNSNGKNNSSSASLVNYSIKIYKKCLKRNDIDEKIKNNNILDNFLKKCLQIYDDDLKKNNDDSILKIYEYRNCTTDEYEGIHPYFDEYTNSSCKNFNNIYFNNDTDKNRLINYANRFNNNNNLHLIQQNSFLFYGPPGCGKTSFIKAIANEQKLHLVSIDIDNINSNEEMKKIFRNNKFNKFKLDYKKILIVIEDIDANNSKMLLTRDNDDNNLNINNLNINNLNINNKLNDESYNETNDNLNNKTNNQNNNISSTDKISNEYIKFMMNNAKKPTLSCFLNILDGIIELPITIIFTTNKIDKIDPAVIRRFGIVHEFKRANHKVIIDMLNIFFNTEMTDYYLINNNYNNLLNNITEYTLSHSEIYYIIQQSQTLFECIDLLNKESHKNLFRIN